MAIGEVDPGQMVTNNTAVAGQQLVLTKALGTGIVATAIKAGRAGGDTIRAATESMATLNRGACEVMRELGIRAATDITGFGLLGHLRQMLRVSGVSATLDSSSLPFLPGVEALSERERFPGGTVRNLKDVAVDVSFPEGMPENRRLLMADAQTSGGLLMAVHSETLPELLSQLAGRAPVAEVIGKLEEGPPGRIQVL